MTDHPTRPVTDADIKYLRQLLDDRYHDWTDDPEARPACERLAAAGFCRVVWEDVKCWRVYTSVEQRDKARELLARRDTLDVKGF